MTNEEAIRELKILKAESTTELTENALDLAIYALEQIAPVIKENASLKKHFKIMTNNMEDN